MFIHTQLAICLYNIFWQLIVFAESGFEPTTFGLPIHCYNHYTNRGV
jgi:hypothetical protein